MEKVPLGLTTKSKKRPRQQAILALLQERPHSKGELKEILSMTTTNLAATLQKMVANAKIIPNPKTGKYELYPKNHD